MTNCSTAKPEIVVKPQVIREKVPAALVTDCRPKQRGSLATTQALVDRLIYTEGALDECGARMKKIRRWNAGQQ